MLRYADLLGEKMEIILLSDDANNRFLAERDFGLKTMSVRTYARTRTDCSELYDIAQSWANEETMETGDHHPPEFKAHVRFWTWTDEDVDEHGKNKKQRRSHYAEHLPLSELKAGIQQGIYYQVCHGQHLHVWKTMLAGNDRNAPYLFLLWHDRDGRNDDQDRGHAKRESSCFW